MLYDLVDAPGTTSPDAVYEAYLEALREVLDSADREMLRAESDLSEADLAALADGDPAEITVADAAAVLAAESDSPGAEIIRQEALDHLLLGMTVAVLDVETIAASVDLDLSPTELQQRIEGRAPMTLLEYAYVHAFVESRKP